MGRPARADVEKLADLYDGDFGKIVAHLVEEDNMPMDWAVNAAHAVLGGQGSDPAGMPDDPPRDGAQEQERAKPELRVVPVSKIKIKATEWLWYQRIPLGALTLLPGREGTGKSTFGAWLTARVTKGQMPGIYEGIPKGVFYAAREDDWERTITPRLIAAGADTSIVYRIDVETSGIVDGLSFPQHCELLRDGIRKHDVGMLFLDPLMSTISGALDTHKDREARTALEPLSAIAMDTGSAVVGLAHFSKAMTTDALNLVMASKAFTAVPRAVIGMARDDEAEEENAVVLSQIKSNLGPLDVPSLKFTFQPVMVDTEDGRSAHVGRLIELGETGRSVADILSGRGDEADQDTWNAACWWLYDYLRDHGGETTARDVWTRGRAAGHSRDSLKRASTTLALVKRKSGFQGQSLWVFDPATSREPEGERPPKAAAAAAGSGKEDPPKKRSRRVAGDGGKAISPRPDAEGDN